MPSRRQPPPVSSRRLTGVPRRGVVLTDPAGRCYIAAFPEQDGGGLVLDGTGGFVPLPPAGGSGDVVGPAGAVDERIAVYDGVTGKLIKDGGMTIADILGLIGAGGGGDVIGPASSVDNRITTFDGVTGKVIQDSGVLLADLATLAGWTATIVPYANASGVLTSNVNNLAYDAVTNRLGVNHSPPDYPLDVRGTPVDIGYIAQFRPAGTGSCYIQAISVGLNEQAGFTFEHSTNGVQWRMGVLGDNGGPNFMRWSAHASAGPFYNHTVFYVSPNSMNMLLASDHSKDVTTGERCFVLEAETAPTAVAADTVALYAKEVDGSVELFAMNEANVETQLTPAAGSSDPLYYEPLTDGDLTQPELVFALGDVIMVAVYS